MRRKPGKKCFCPFFAKTAHQKLREGESIQSQAREQQRVTWEAGHGAKNFRSQLSPLLSEGSHECAPGLKASKSIRAHNRERAVRKRRAIRLPKGGRPIRNREGSRGELVQECAQRRRGLALPQTRPPSCLPGRARWPPQAHLGLRRSRMLYRSSESAPHFCVHITVGAKPSATR